MTQNFHLGSLPSPHEQPPQIALNHIIERTRKPRAPPRPIGPRAILISERGYTSSESKITERRVNSGSADGWLKGGERFQPRIRQATSARTYGPNVRHVIVRVKVTPLRMREGKFKLAGEGHISRECTVHTYGYTLSQRVNRESSARRALCPSCQQGGKVRR